MSGAISSSIAARDLLGHVGGMEPELALRLADLVVRESLEPGTRVVLDFTGVGAISSGFANAFFLALGKVRRLDEWRVSLDFVGLGPLQSEIMRRSLAAARSVSP